MGLMLAEDIDELVNESVERLCDCHGCLEWFGEIACSGGGSLHHTIYSRMQ